MEERLEANRARDAWSSFRYITGFQRKSGGATAGRVQRAKELQQFFNRFDDSSPYQQHHQHLQQSPSH